MEMKQLSMSLMPDMMMKKNKPEDDADEDDGDDDINDNDDDNDGDDDGDGNDNNDNDDDDDDAVDEAGAVIATIKMRKPDKHRRDVSKFEDTKNAYNRRGE